MKLLIFQHIAVEHPGSFRGLMKRKGIHWDVVALNEGAAIPELSAYDGLLVFGGPMDVWEEKKHPWLVAEKKAIRTFVKDLAKPFLGICLGHQLLADAFGGEVGPMATAEVGVVPLRLTRSGREDSLLEGFDEPLMALQWHSSEVKRLPNDAVCLAENDACSIQAFRIGDYAYGLQYHIEVERPTVDEWSQVDAYSCALQAVKGPDGQQQLKADAFKYMNEFEKTAEVLFDRFCRLATECNRRPN